MHVFLSAASTRYSGQLVSILREVKYLRQLERQDIPEEAATMDDNSMMYRQFVSNLELICIS